MPLSENELELIRLMASNLENALLGLFDENDMLYYCNQLFSRAVHLRDEDSGKGLDHFFDLSGTDISRENRCISPEIMILKIKPDLRLYNIHLIPYRDHLILIGHLIETEGVDMLSSMAMEFNEIANLNREIRHKNRELKNANNRIEELVHTDPLTGLNNRHHFIDKIDELIHTSKRHSLSLSAIMCDIDHFKKINDTFGHETGDKVLMRFAAILMESFRREDYLVRYGGEEFIVLLPHTELNTALEAAERVRKKIQSDSGFYPASVTASFGVSRFTGEETASEFLKRIDLALYNAKNGGRNCIKAL
ncbi:MAG: GGDEF domain-containing protein [Spirochaetales bacterium]|nr:GGDEF domain-containing protein [Spirochaetales bacterium]